MLNHVPFLDVALLSGKIVLREEQSSSSNIRLTQCSSVLALLAVPFCLTVRIQERESAQLSSISLCVELQVCLININGSCFLRHSATLHLQHRSRIGWLAATIHHCYLMLSPGPE